MVSLLVQERAGLSSAGRAAVVSVEPTGALTSLLVQERAGLSSAGRAAVVSVEPGDER